MDGLAAFVAAGAVRPACFSRFARFRSPTLRERTLGGAQGRSHASNTGGASAQDLAGRWL